MSERTINGADSMIEKIEELEKRRYVILDQLMRCVEGTDEYQKHCREIVDINEQLQAIIDEM